MNCQKCRSCIIIYVINRDGEIPTLMEIKGYIIEKYTKMTGAYTCNRIVEEASKLDMNLKIIGIVDTLVLEDEIRTYGMKLEKRDFVINRYKWGKAKDETNLLAAKSYNSLHAYNIYVNKYEQVKRLRSEAFVVPKYLLGTAMLSFDEITNLLGKPFVAKGLESSMGRQIFLVEKEEDLKKICEEYGEEKEWLFEEFVTTSYGKDIRFYSIRGEVVACMQRKSKGDFRANVALGASVEEYEITPGIRQIAKDVYEQTGLDFLGIDLLFGKDKPYFCEINVMPGIKGMEAATGINVAKRIVETIKNDFM